MSTETLTLTDFLLARIAEDEAEINSFGEPAPMEAGPIPYGRLLAECEAKRRIAEMFAADFDEVGLPSGEGGYGEAYCDALRHLALPYAEHPDYRGSWRP